MHRLHSYSVLWDYLLLSPDPPLSPLIPDLKVGEIESTLMQMNSPLSPGTTLGRYEIRSPIGEGGMGEVFLARDTQLDPEAWLTMTYLGWVHIGG
jgi:hypothetical protein